MGIPDRPRIRLAEDEHVLVPLFEFLLSSGESIFATLQRGNGRLETLPMQRLVVEPFIPPDSKNNDGRHPRDYYLFVEVFPRLDLCRLFGSDRKERYPRSIASGS